MRNAHRIVSIEYSLGIFVELDVQRYALYAAHKMVISFLNNFYLFAHIPCSVSFLLWVFFYHRKNYYVFRNSFLLAHMTCIIIQILFPCAPPRMIKDYGFVDTMLTYSNSDLMVLEETAGVNPYGAMPSMHFCYAFLVGSWGMALSKSITRKILFAYYSIFVFFVVIATGNHFIMDCMVALIVNIVSYFIVSIRKNESNV